MQKKASKSERAVWVRNMCEFGMRKGIDVTDCCSWVVNLAVDQGISSDDAIREVCEPKFKNQMKVLAKEGMTFAKTGKDTKEVKKLKKVAGEKLVEMEAHKLKLETSNTQLQTQIDGLTDDNKKLNNVMEDLQQQLRIVANISHEAKCQCGKLTEIKVDASSGRIIITDKK